jgi:perosamine synthetase
VSTPFEVDAAIPEDSIPLCAPEIRGNEWQYIKQCLDTGWVSSAGSFVDRFEAALAEYVGAQYAVAMVNGTAALHTALLVAGVLPGDEVLVSTLSFIAPANAIRYVGAWPVFIDAEPAHWQMDPQRVIDFLEQKCSWHCGRLTNRTTGRQIRAILPVHILGHPVDLDPIITVARQYNLPVIEDATESLGAKYTGRMVGQLGDIACFSFNGNKIITCGGGGMIVTDNEAWAREARYLSTQAKDDSEEYIHHRIGYNYRLNNLQAAMGYAQLEQLEHYIVAKRQLAHTYTEAFSHVPGIEPMREAAWAHSIFWMYTVLVEPSIYSVTSRELSKVLSEQKVQTRPLWQPLHQSEAHTEAEFHKGHIADQLYENALSLPCSVGLTDEAQQRVIELIASR